MLHSNYPSLGPVLVTACLYQGHPESCSIQCLGTVGKKSSGLVCITFYSLIKDTHKYIEEFHVSVVSSCYQQNMKCSFAFLLSSNSRLFVEKGSQHVPDLGSCAVWDLCKEPQGASWSVPQTEHLDFHSSSVRHCKASWTSGIVIGREKSRMDVHVSPAGRSRQLWGLLMSHFMIVYSTPGKFSSGIQAIKRVVKLQQKLLAKSNVPGWRRSQVGTSRTGSNQL